MSRCYDQGVTANAYFSFVPSAYRVSQECEPDSTWWTWRGHAVHIARARRPAAATRVLLVHGIGSHGEALWPLAAILAERGCDTAAVDLPLFGRTHTPRPPEVRYIDWVRLLVDLLAAEDDGRPVLLLGASTGGMLAYEAAARSTNVDAVLATSLLDPLDPHVRAHLTRFGTASRFATAMAPRLPSLIDSRMIPVSYVADCAKMSRSPELSRLCATDPHGGGARVPLGFLTSFSRFRHTPPELMRTPVVVAHPTHDAWTPAELSMPFIRRIAAPTRVVMLRECGHIPIEEPGFTDLVDTVIGLADQVSKAD